MTVADLRTPSWNHLPWSDRIAEHAGKLPSKEAAEPEESAEGAEHPCTFPDIGRDGCSHGFPGDSEEEEFYDFILCFREGDYHVAEVVAVSRGSSSSAASVRESSRDSLPEDGEGSFHDDGEREIERDTAQSNAAAAAAAAAVRTENGAQCPAKDRVSQGSFSWMLNIPAPYSSEEDGDSPRSSFTFPPLKQMDRSHGSPARLPKLKRRRSWKGLALKAYFTCCRF